MRARAGTGCRLGGVERAAEARLRGVAVGSACKCGARGVRGGGSGARVRRDVLGDARRVHGLVEDLARRLLADMTGPGAARDNPAALGPRLAPVVGTRSAACSAPAPSRLVEQAERAVVALLHAVAGWSCSFGGPRAPKHVGVVRERHGRHLELGRARPDRGCAGPHRASRTRSGPVDERRARTPAQLTQSGRQRIEDPVPIRARRSSRCRRGRSAWRSRSRLRHLGSLPRNRRRSPGRGRCRRST